MHSTLILPLEIEEIILNLLAEDDNNHSALKACSLVCQAFLPICRKHIFESIFISNYLYHPGLRSDYAFQRLLYHSPDITPYIRKLDYSLGCLELRSHFPSFSGRSSIPFQDSFNRISRLEFLTVRFDDELGFGWIHHPVRPALLHLLHLPTLIHFNVIDCSNFMLSDLIPCVNLKYLRIGSHTTWAAETTFPAALHKHPPIQLKEFVADRTPGDVVTHIFAARRTDGQPLVDFGSLSKITMNITRPGTYRTSQQLFRGCQNLTDVTIYLWYRHRYVTLSLADMLRPSLQTLKHIVVYFDIYDIDEDPLIGIPSELEDMRARNIIETVTIGVFIRTDKDCRRGDEWGRLDEVLTTPGWFSLKRVSLTINVSSCLRYDNNLEMALRKLPETQFPRLSTSNSLSFYFEVTTTFTNL
ncbi:hypothetical protein M413DRAFT_444688 [Hebeloma cylindrosporum]|uniref:F-box domain-containing protein n=1 Tax=Hebeloma cylindrosporum TaxID=76867 RepID=A0A0C3CF61_HEBCY|nr:hypothetical protein M413DRAFT_444688 [Hebeloma cylindrosporum h7]